MSTNEAASTIYTGKEIVVPTTSADLSKANISNPYFTIQIIRAWFWFPNL
jgi:hypothetical protein